jgi:hypothetical protein
MPENGPFQITLKDATIKISAIGLFILVCGSTEGVSVRERLMALFSVRHRLAVNHTMLR